MAKARLMNTPEDYRKLGINPEKIEIWEDGRRSPQEKGTWEWWYFDTILDDGTKVVIQFFPKSGADLRSKNDHPKFTIKATTPDGKEYKEEAEYPAHETTWGTDKCNFSYGKNYCSGDLTDYHVHVEPIKGLGADLRFHSLSKPYRPGSSYFCFETEDDYFTWLCVMPKGEVSGTVTINGEERSVHGTGYHDHQWGKGNFLMEWNHWVWARQGFDDYSLMLFDFVSNSKTEYTRFPIICIEDKEGNLVFSNDKAENVKCEVLGEYHDEASGKDYPSAFHYTFRNADKTVEYTLQMNEILECNGINNLPPAKKLIVKMAGLSPAYTRYAATGSLVIDDGREKIERTGKLIYEFMYPGDGYKDHI